MPTRAYRSPRRAAAAAATRAAVLDAALRLFEERGYAATTVADVAGAAGVAVNTVYSSVGGKPQLLVGLIGQAAGDPAADATMRAIASATTGEQVVRLLAAGTRRVFERHAWVLGELYDNAADEAISHTRAAAECDYRERLAAAAARLVAVRTPGPGPSADRCADVLWFYFGFRAWRDLRELGWSWDDAEAWLVGQADLAVLGTNSSAGPGRGWAGSEA